MTPETTIVAIIVLIGTISSTVVGPVILSMLTDRQSRAREDRQIVRQNEVARLAAAAASAQADQLNHIGVVADATHKIVNNQRTVMLRSLAVLARKFSNAFPKDTDLRKAAEAAEHDLELNEQENADPATKVAPTEA